MDICEHACTQTHTHTPLYIHSTATYLIYKFRNAESSVNFFQACGICVAQECVQLVQQCSFITLAFKVRRWPKEIIQGTPKKWPKKRLRFNFNGAFPLKKKRSK